MAPTLDPGEFAAEFGRLRERAATLAAELGSAADALRTLGRERAILRLIGVAGIDREGRPLAAEVVDRYVAGRPDRLASGVAIPFAIALLEYDSTPQQLALDVAAGSVDLGFEAQLLSRPDRRAAANERLGALVSTAIDRIDANRTARAELVQVLGDRRMPWIGTTLLEPSAVDAAAEATQLVRAGVDLIRVEVPAGRELAMRLGEIGKGVAAWRPTRDDEDDPAPSGSQRGLTRLRDVLDAAAAERGSYVRLATVPAALAGPEGAVVAAFERADLVELDPMTEIIGSGVDPARAIADFAFGARLARRSGTVVHVGAGPLVVAPDLDSGVNSDAATRAGRALGLQLLLVALGEHFGLDAGSVIVGAIPAWITDEPDAAARSAAEVAVRSALLPDHRMAFLEPQAADAGVRWHATMSSIMPALRTALVLRRPAAGASFGALAEASRIAAAVTGELQANLAPRHLRGRAAEHAAASVAAAGRTLDLLAANGWTALTGARETGGGWGRLGGDAVAPAAEPMDAVERALR